MIRLLVISLVLTSFSLRAGEGHKIEMYIFNDRSIPIEHLLTPESFYSVWYGLAKKYKPSGVPILTSHDVIQFDTVNFELSVSEQGWKHISELGIPIKGIPVMIVVDGKIAYGAWLWSMLSSFSCPGVSYHFSEATEGKKLLILQGSDFTNEMRIPIALKEVN